MSNIIFNQLHSCSIAEISCTKIMRNNAYFVEKRNFF
nr:MAG TPA: hypothetical protein [Caudoviricetes sp.]